MKPAARVSLLLGQFGLLGVLLAGCVTVAPMPAVPPEPDLPAGWAAEQDLGGVPADARWWARFDDVLLLRCLDEALRANTTVTAAEAALRQSRALADAGAAGLQPQLGGRASAQRTRGSGNSGGSGNLFQAGVDASWELDVFGGRHAGVRALDATALASAASLADVRVSIAAEVGLRYIALRGLQARIQVAERNLATQRQTLQITDWRTQAGLLSTLELQQARASAAQTEALLPLLRATARQTTHALAVLVGQPPAALNELLQPGPPLPTPEHGLALALPAQTLRQRPDVRAAEQQVLAASARLAQADAARYPSFNLGGSLGLQALTLGGLGNGPLLASALFSGAWALWDGGAVRAQIDAQDAALVQARSAYRSTVLTALQEVEDALVALAGDRARGDSLALAATAAEAAAGLANQRFLSGLVDFQTVLETQRSQLATQDALATARTDLSSDHVRLFKALGGGWRPEAAAER